MSESTSTPISVSDASSGNFGAAFAGGLAAALLGAVIWAAVTVITDYQLGLIAIAVGFLVGFAVRKFGNGTSLAYGILGGALALLGCVVGNVLTIFAVIGKLQSVSFFEAFAAIPLSEIPSLMAETFSAMDLVFYAIAVYEGFKLATRPRDAA